MSTALRPPLAVEETVTYTTPDHRYRITLQRVREDAYRVDVYQGTLRVEDNCGSYPTEVEARAVARGYAQMYLAETAQPAAFADLAAHGSHRQVRPTMAGAHLAPLSAAQTRIISTHRDGIVYAGDGVRWTVLQSIVRKGYATVNAYQPGGKKISSIRLNKRGHNAVKAGAR